MAGGSILNLKIFLAEALGHGLGGCFGLTLKRVIFKAAAFAPAFHYTFFNAYNTLIVNIGSVDAVCAAGLNVFPEKHSPHLISCPAMR